MIILGVDPGSQNLGYGVIQLVGSEVRYKEHGVISEKPGRPFYERLHDLGVEFSKVVDRFGPTWVSVEKVFLAKNADSAFKLGHIRGVCIFECLKRQVRVAEYATREIKKGVTGQGSAEKEQVAMLLEAAMGLERGRVTGQSLDASDALAAAYYHAQRILLDRRLKPIEA